MSKNAPAKQAVLELQTQLKSKLELNELGSATQLICQATEAELSHFSISMLCGRIYAKLGDADKAKHFFNQAIVVNSAKAAPHLQLAKLTLDTKCFEQAALHLDKAEQLEGPQLELLRLRWKLAQVTNDISGELEILPQLLKMETKPAFFKIRRLINLYLGQKKYEAAQHYISQHESLLTVDQVAMLNGELAQEQGLADVSLASLQAAVTANSNNTEALASLIKLNFNLGNKKTAFKLVEDAIDNGIADVKIYRLTQNLTLPKHLLNKVIHWAEQVPENASAATQAVAVDIISLAFGDADGLLVKEHGATREQEVQSHKIPFIRPLVKDELSEITIAAVAGAKKVILVFTGLSNRTGMSLRQLDSYFATMNVSVIYLRDSSRLIFNNGIGDV